MKLTTAEIQAILPHRYPMLMVDRVEALVPGESVTAIKNVTMNEDVFQGHFPGNPTFPGVYLIEALAQAGAIALLSMPEFKGQTAYLAGVPKARFKQKVVPGDQLRLEVTLDRIRGALGEGTGTAYVGDTKVTTVKLVFAIGA